MCCSFHKFKIWYTLNLAVITKYVLSQLKVNWKLPTSSFRLLEIGGEPNRLITKHKY